MNGYIITLLVWLGLSWVFTVLRTAANKEGLNHAGVCGATIGHTLRFGTWVWLLYMAGALQ